MGAAAALTPPDDFFLSLWVEKLDWVSHERSHWLGLTALAQLGSSAPVRLSGGFCVAGTCGSALTDPGGVISEIRFEIFAGLIVRFVAVLVSGLRSWAVPDPFLAVSQATDWLVLSYIC